MDGAILLSLALLEWPARDRDLWLAATAPRGGRFLKRGIAARWRPATLANYQQQYGAWLSFLSRRGELDPSKAPEDRVTRELMDLYVEELLERGSRGPSIATRIVGLRHALRLVAAGVDFSWVGNPGGQHIRSVMDMAPRAKSPRFSHDLYLWALELIEEPITDQAPYNQALCLRDGLIIAFLASRGMRRRSLGSLKIGGNLLRDTYTARWRIDYSSEDMKCGNALSYRLPAEVCPAIDRYLAEGRQLLLRGKDSRDFWIGARGEKMADEALAAVVIRRSAKRFGHAEKFGPHAFRHALATSVGLGLPNNPGAAANLLGNGIETIQKHYDWSKDSAAAALYQKAMNPMRHDD